MNDRLMRVSLYIFRKEDGQLEYYVEGEFVKELTPRNAVAAALLGSAHH